MLQRIQTLYLLATAGLLAAMLFADFATVTAGAEVQTLTAFGVYGNDYYLFALIALAIVATLTAVFSYKKRRFQIRLCFALLVLLAGIMAFIALYVLRMKEALEAVPHAMRYSLVNAFPLVALILVYLAYRGIVRDEALVRALDRIR